MHEENTEIQEKLPDQYFGCQKGRIVFQRESRKNTSHLFKLLINKWRWHVSAFVPGTG